MVGGEVGNRPNMGVLVDNLRLAGSRLVGDIVDTVGLVGFAIGVNHGSIVSLARKTFFLQVSILVPVPADDVGVPGTVGTGLAIVAGRVVVPLWREAVVAGSDGGDRFDLLLCQILPDDLLGFIWWKFCFDNGNPVRHFVVILDGLQVASCLHAFTEGCFCGLQDLVADAVLEASQEELMPDNFEGVRNTFSFGFLDSKSCRSGGSHGGRLVVSETLIGYLVTVGVIMDGLVHLLGEVREVGASGFGQVLGFVALQEFSFDNVPVVHIDSIFYEPFEPTDSLVPKAHLELKNFTSVIPASNGGSVIGTYDENASRDGVSALLAVEKQNVS